MDKNKFDGLTVGGWGLAMLLVGTVVGHTLPRKEVDNASEKPVEFIQLDQSMARKRTIECPLCAKPAKLVEINQDTHSIHYHLDGDIYDCGTHQTECKHGTSEVVSSVKKTKILWQRIFE